MAMCVFPVRAMSKSRRNCKRIDSFARNIAGLLIISVVLPSYVAFSVLCHRKSIVQTLAESYLSELDYSIQRNVPLVHSASVLDHIVGGYVLADKECPCRQRGIYLHIQHFVARMSWTSLHSAHPLSLGMKNEVYNLIQTNGVLTAR